MEQIFNKVVRRIESDKEHFDNKLCSGYWLKLKRLQNNFDKKEAWELFTKEIAWLINLDYITTDEIVKWFDANELAEHNIYFTGIHKVQGGRHIGIKDAHLISTLHTEVILFDNSTAKCYDTTFLTAYNNSKAEVVECIATALDDSEVVANGARVELFDNAKCENKGDSLIVRG